MAALTLNQVVKRIETLALSHQQVNHFYFGEPHEFWKDKGINYAAVFCELQPMIIDRTQRQTFYVFRIYVADLVGVSMGTERNEQEVLSDTSSIIQDLLALFSDPTYDTTWYLQNVTNAAYFTESGDDMVAGWVSDVTIGVDFLSDRCQVPSSDVEPENDIDMPRTRMYNYTADGSEGESWAVPDLSGKHILAAWRAGYYKRAVNVAPGDDEKIQVGTTDLGEGRGILGNGNVILRSGDAPIANEKFDFLYYA